MGSKRNPQIAVLNYFTTADLRQVQDTLALARAKVREREKAQSVKLAQPRKKAGEDPVDVPLFEVGTAPERR